MSVCVLAAGNEGLNTVAEHKGLREEGLLEELRGGGGGQASRCRGTKVYQLSLVPGKSGLIGGIL